MPWPIIFPRACAGKMDVLVRPLQDNIGGGSESFGKAHFLCVCGGWRKEGGQLFIYGGRTLVDLAQTTVKCRSSGG